MQQYEDPGTFQGYQYHKNPPHGLQGQGQQTKKGGVIYKYKCLHINCPEEFVGESVELLGTGSRTILGSYPLSITIATLQDTQSALNVLPLLTGSMREAQGTFRRLCVSMYMTLHLTGTRESINSLTYGIRFYKTHLHSCSNNPALPPFSLPLYYKPPCTPLIPTTPHNLLYPHFSTTIFGKYTHLFL